MVILQDYSIWRGYGGRHAPCRDSFSNKATSILQSTPRKVRSQANTVGVSSPKTPDGQEDKIKAFRRWLISTYGIELPSPKERKQTYANASFFRILSALVHFCFHSRGISADGQPITTEIMQEAVNKGKWSKLIKNDLDPNRALYRYMKNTKGISKWFRGDSSTGYEIVLKNGSRTHSRLEDSEQL